MSIALLNSLGIAVQPRRCGPRLGLYNTDSALSGFRRAGLGDGQGQNFAPGRARRAILIGDSRVRTSGGVDNFDAQAAQLVSRLLSKPGGSVAFAGMRVTQPNGTSPATLAVALETGNWTGGSRDSGATDRSIFEGSRRSSGTGNSIAGWLNNQTSNLGAGGQYITSAGRITHAGLMYWQAAGLDTAAKFGLGHDGNLNTDLATLSPGVDLSQIIINMAGDGSRRVQFSPMIEKPRSTWATSQLFRWQASGGAMDIIGPYVAYGATGPGLMVIDASVSGSTLNNYLDGAWLSDLGQLTTGIPSYVSVLDGWNGIVAGWTVTQIRERMRAMAEWGRANGVPILFKLIPMGGPATTAQVNTFIQGYVKGAYDLANEFDHVGVLDLGIELGGWSYSFIQQNGLARNPESDTVHYGINYHMAMADIEFSAVSRTNHW
jgi:hypothetical protein